MEEKTELITPEYIKKCVHVIRGQQVMLDEDLANIYGYEVKRLKEQVKRNIGRFPEDFLFQLTREETEYIEKWNQSVVSDNLKSQIATSSWGGKRKLPYAFTEQGIYMLSTVLKGDLAIQQSIAIMRLFKQMKDFIVENQTMLTKEDVLKLTLDNSDEIKKINKSLSKMATKKDLINLQKQIDSINNNILNESSPKEFVVESGKKFEADVFYINLFKQAHHSIIIIDNYISIKTLSHLAHCKSGIDIILITEKTSRSRDKLREAEYKDFVNEYKQFNISIKDANKCSHDRFIIIDYEKDTQKIYTSGPSIKDAGNKFGQITLLSDAVLKPELVDLIKNGNAYIW